MMSNMSVTNNDVGSVVAEDAKYIDGLVHFTVADTYQAGTILAVDSTTDKYVPFIPDSTENNHWIPKAILTYQVELNGTGDVSTRVAVSGCFKKNRLVIHGGNNITQKISDQLRNYGLVPLDVSELNILENH